MKRYMLFVYGSMQEKGGWQNFVMSDDDLGKLLADSERMLVLFASYQCQEWVKAHIADADSGSVTHKWNDSELLWAEAPKDSE